MARATPSRNGDKTLDAIALLKQDHREVEQLFEQFEDTEDGEGIPIAQRVCQLLTVHAQIEEEILYPAAKEAFSSEDEEEEMVYEAEVEHGSAKELIAKIEDMTEQNEQYNATVKVLSEYVKHHVKEEETEMFPALRKTELDLKEMGARLYERKQQLMTAMGVVEQEPAPAASRKKSASSARRSTKARTLASRAKSKSKSSSRAARH